MPRYFDNSPMTLMHERLAQAMRRLSFHGCEILEVRFDAFKAVILVAAPAGLAAGDSEQGHAVHQYARDIRVVWSVAGKEGAG